MGEPRTTIKISTPSDLLDTVPYLLGFRPAESLVAVLVDANGKAMSARFDLPDSLPAFRHTLDYLTMATNRHQAAHVVLVAFTERARLGDHVLAFIRDNWHRTSAALGITVSANPDGWALIDTDTDAARRPYRPGTLIPAKMVAAGNTVDNVDQHQRRARYMRTPTAADLADMADAIGSQRGRAAEIGVAQRCEEVRDYIDVWNDQHGTLAVSDAAYLVAMIGDSIEVRDAALLHLDMRHADDQMILWEYVAAHVDEADALPILAIWATAAWLSGDGHAANGILARAAATPGGDDYAMLRLLASALAAAMPPSEWEAIRNALQ